MMISRERHLSLMALATTAFSTVLHAQLPRTLAADSQKHVAALVEFDKVGVKADKTYLYWVQRLNGINNAVAIFGLERKVFDAQGSLVSQANTAQNAVAENFDGYTFGQLTGAPSCALWTSTLVLTGKPVATVTLPICGGSKYTPSLATTITMQGAVQYQQLLDHASSSCTNQCQVAAIGGFVGSDLQNYWEPAIKNATEKYPNA